MFREENPTGHLVHQIPDFLFEQDAVLLPHFFGCAFQDYYAGPVHFLQPPLPFARDKMPLEVTPVYFKLQRYSATNNAGPAPANAAPGQPASGGDPGNSPAPTATPGPPATPPSASQPVPGENSSAQQQPPPTPTPQLR